MDGVNGQKIIVGVTGGIAAYKSPDFVRRLRERGADVQVVLTDGGSRFITELTLQAVSGNPVRTDLLDPAAEAGMGHIELARWADAIVVAPASANFMARLAQGRADDLLSTICLATNAPIALAPAMNRLMWSNAATQANVDTLVSRGIELWGPGDGEQACGEVGQGRMLEPTELVDRLASLVSPGALTGQRVVVTAGPTREPIDPVRYISNRSSGKMGYAVAEALALVGAEVTLITGPVALPRPARVQCVEVETAAEMQAAVESRLDVMDLFVATAAVADYRPSAAQSDKIKKQADAMQLDLVRNDDILAAVSAADKPIFTVGFAAETNDLESYAQGKLEAKSLDMIAANWVGDGRGFDRDDNALLVLTRDGLREELGPAPKAALARQLVDLVVQTYCAKADRAVVNKLA